MAAELQTLIATGSEVSTPEVEIQVVNEGDISAPEVHSTIVTEVQTLAPTSVIATYSVGSVLSVDINTKSLDENSASEVQILHGL